MTVEQYRNAVADVLSRFPVSNQPSVEASARGGGLDNQTVDQGVPGLRGDYYQSRGMNKADQLGQYRSDLRMEFDFGTGSPAPSIAADQFAIVWQGGLIATQTGHYEFRLQTVNGARMYLNMDPQPNRRKLRDDSSLAGQTALIDAWVGSGELQEKTARVFLLGGRTYPIRLEFFKYLEDDASVKLEWKPPQGTWSVLDYNHTITTLPGRLFVSEAPFPADDRSLGFERGSSVSPQWQVATMNGAIEAAAEVVNRLPFLAGIVEDEQDDDETVTVSQDKVALVQSFITEFATVAYRRPLAEDERALLLEVVGSDEEQLEAGVRRAVILVLMSPHFLYLDLTPAETTPTSHAVASRLAFTLWDSVPDRELLDAAGSGGLDSLEEIEAQAKRMLEDDRTKAKMQSFFRNWLELEQRDLSKDRELFPDFDEAVIADLRRSLELFLDRVVWSRDSDYRQLLTANYLMLNDRLSAIYGSAIDEPSNKSDGEEIKRRADMRQFASEFQPVEFSKDHRSGVLTHPYLLSAFAYHNNTSPIHRGVFLTRNIVGRALSPPPMAIAFKDDEFAPDLTMREKVTQLTSDAACMSCHSVINPLGFTLESFDAVGRWRTSDQQKPIDTKSQYTTESGETVELDSAKDVADVALRSPSAHRAFVTHLFEHMVKQSATEFPVELLDHLPSRFEKDEFNIQKLIARIAALAAAEDLIETTALLAEDSP
jgi:hypothetical protein